MKMSDMVIGVGLVILGILFLSENFGYIAFDFQHVWPVFVLLAGVGFWVGYFQDRKNYGLLMPGSILIVYGFLFLYCSIEGWYLMSYWWPVFILGPGIGFFMMYQSLFSRFVDYRHGFGEAFLHFLAAPESFERLYCFSKKGSLHPVAHTLILVLPNSFQR